jgi:hypothetical protein
MWVMEQVWALEKVLVWVMEQVWALEKVLERVEVHYKRRGLR